MAGSDAGPPLQGLPRPDGQYRWRLKDGNSRIVATGESFATKDRVIASIGAIRRKASRADLTLV